MARYVAAASRIYGPNADLTVPSTASGALSNGNTGAAANGETSSAPVPITNVLQGWQGSIMAQPIVWLFGLVLFLVAWKLIEEKRGGAETFAKIRVDGTNLVKVTGLALLGFIILRFTFTKVSVPGLSTTVLYGLGINGSGSGP
jgi:hypothetical protein